MDTIAILRELVYLVAAVTFIVGLKRLSSPATARSGNQVAAAGMALAVLATFVDPRIQGMGYLFIIVGAVIGGGIGFFLGRNAQMTGLPPVGGPFYRNGG